MKKRRKEIRRDKQLQAVVKRLWNVAETKNFRISRFEYLDYHLPRRASCSSRRRNWESGMSTWKDDAKGQDLLATSSTPSSSWRTCTPSRSTRSTIAFLQVLFTEATKPGKPKRSWKHVAARLALDVVEKVVPLLAEYTDKGCEGALPGPESAQAIRRSSLVMLQEAVGLVKESNKRAKQPENGFGPYGARHGLGLAAERRGLRWAS